MLPADAIVFVCAGEQMATNRGTVYYPHSGVIQAKGQRLPYSLGPEGGSKQSPTGVFVKELSQVFGLPDLAARTENAGSEGLGRWWRDVRSVHDQSPATYVGLVQRAARLDHADGHRSDETAASHPRPDRVVAGGVFQGPGSSRRQRVLPALVRARRGFDADLPGEGLLIWRVVNGRPILEESHGVEGPDRPDRPLGVSPYPSPANNSFTPDTIPSSRSPKGGGLPVNITDIRRLPDGRVSFRIGYEYE